MSFKNSYSNTMKNRETWTNNLVHFQTLSRRGNVAIYETPLNKRSRMPLKKHVIGRFKFLASTAKERRERIGTIALELKELWREILNFPHISEQAIHAKIAKLLKDYELCRKKQNFDSLEELFDVTKFNGEWLCKEDENLYKLQIRSKGRLGYSTGKHADVNSIHPSKRKKSMEANVSTLTSSSIPVCSDGSTDSTDNSKDSLWADENAESPTKRRHNSTSIARRLITSSKLSSHKAERVCRHLRREGFEIPTPTQPAIHKSIYKRALKVKNHLASTLHLEKWSLHFDGKHIEGFEYQAVVLKNESKEIKLTAIKMTDGKAQTIAEGLRNVLEEFNLWGSIAMIIADTTSVNTGKKTGVVVRLQKMFEERGHPKPTFVSCQHHVLDRVLRIVMDDELKGSTKSPNIEYFFVPDLMSNYHNLKAAFSNGTTYIKETGGWRDDMKFLYHLTRVFRHFTERSEMPFVNFKTIPNISNARWNSRAILAILAFILMPETRNSLHTICSFISYHWADHWFDSQMYRAEAFEELSSVLHDYPRALRCVKTHWKTEESPINITRSNQCSERSIKVIQEMHDSCKNKDYIPLRFILLNDDMEDM